jgi:transposase
VASYFGLIPRDHSSGGRQRLGHISKQGSSFLRFLLVEAEQSAARYDRAGPLLSPAGGAQES